jgi:RNA polymerase sigma factor (sigma-70 family)
VTPRRLIEPARLAGTPLLRTQSDARLVDLVRAGHAAAFEAIVQRYRRPLLKYCSRLLPGSRAEDAVQQTFLKAYQSMISGDAEINLRPWLYKIAHNSSLNLLRQNGWNYDELDENFDGVQRPDQALELRERLRATVKAVKQLPERQRDAVLLREVEGLSYEEIGAALGVGDGAVRQLLHRARATLRAGATAVTPVGLIERLAAAVQAGGDPATRVAETAAGIGASAGVVKIGAAVLATGAIATGAAVTGPLSHDSHRVKAASPVAEKPAAAAAAPIAPSGGSRSEDVSITGSHRESGKGKSGHGKSGSGKHGHRGRDGGGDGSSHHGPSEHRGPSGGDDHSGTGSGGTDDRHSGSRDRHRGSDGGGDRSGSSGRSGGSGSGSTGSGDDHSGSTTLSDGGGDRHGGDGGSGGGSSESGSGSGSGTSGEGGSVPTTTAPLPPPTDESGGSHDGGR